MRLQKQYFHTKSMHDILILLIFTTVRLLSLLFNILLFVVLFYFADRSRIPTVYIYNMLLGNSGEIVTGFIIHLFPMVLDDDTYSGFRNSVGAVITLSSTFSYEHPLYLTLLMIIQRICCVFYKKSWVFSDGMVWIYCASLAIMSLASLLIPFFSNCRINANQRTSSFEAACVPDRHPITLFQNRYLLLVPVISMLLNILLIIYLSLKKRHLERSMNTNRIGIIRRTNQSQSAVASQNFEKTLLVQSISTTTFLLIYELSGLFIRSIPDAYSQLSPETRRVIFYTRTTTASPLCFLVYFICTPSVRRLLIDRLTDVYKGVTSGAVTSIGGGLSTGVIT